MDEARQVLEFWFGAPGSPGHGQRRDAWFKKDAAFDAEIRARFLTLWERAHQGALAAWATERASLLAFIVLTDQFPRNMFRGDPRTFATDPQALAAARTMLERGWDAQCSLYERAFVYLPFEHAESIADQDRSVALYATLRGTPDGDNYHDYAIRHRDIVVRFGRFPHRNAVLGRPSTPEEVEFLKQPGSSF